MRSEFQKKIYIFALCGLFNVHRNENTIQRIENQRVQHQGDDRTGVI